MQPDLEREVAAAVQRFPDLRQAIEERAARDEEFRSICPDFAQRRPRCADYCMLADELVEEIEKALTSANP